jgi:hypothetical protein
MFDVKTSHKKRTKMRESPQPDDDDEPEEEDD